MSESLDPLNPRHEPLSLVQGETEATAGYEKTDVDIRGVLALVGGIAGGVALTLFGVRAFLGMLEQETAMRSKPKTPPIQRPVLVPPLPRLQAEPFEDYQVFLQQQTTHLSNYGWTDRRAGIVHIPIDTAIERLARQGLPPVAEDVDVRIDIAPAEPTSGAPQTEKGE